MDPAKSSGNLRIADKFKQIRDKAIPFRVHLDAEAVEEMWCDARDIHAYVKEIQELLPPAPLQEDQERHLEVHNEVQDWVESRRIGSTILASCRSRP